jgi:UPF0755 protein
MKKMNIKNFRKPYILIPTIILSILFLIAAIGSWAVFTPFCSEKGNSYIYIDNNDNADSVYQKLRPNAASVKILTFRLLCHFYDYQDKVKSGKYNIGNGLRTIDLFRNLRNGNQEPVRITIPSTRTLEQLVARIAPLIAPDSATLMKHFTDSIVCKEYGCTPHTIQTLFLPNTYEFYWNVTPQQFLARMKKESDRYWTDEKKEKAQKLGLTCQEIITLASIVDQETAYTPEKPAIARMYLNRLEKDMPLQADPTIKYALKDFGLRRILHKHLTVDSPYNTYKNKGLPPGPISIPSMSSIEAVLNADDNDFLYMCAKEDFSGSHNFARSYNEHLQNARKYTKALNERGIK